MGDVECIAFLQWALPQLHLRWRGFRNVRRQVCRRVHQRCAELGLPDMAAYRLYLEERAEEWAELGELCRVTISRFGRDRGIWERLTSEILPRMASDAVAEGRSLVAAWSAGCGAGEEPLSLVIAWSIEVAPHHAGLALDVLATDIDDVQLARARTACYPPGTLRELPEHWRRAAFEERDGLACLRDTFRRRIRFVHQDVRTMPPSGPFDLILCRNLAFTYFDESLQLTVAAALRSVLRATGVLVVGIHERLPDETPGFAPMGRGLYRKASHEPGVHIG